MVKKAAVFLIALLLLSSCSIRRAIVSKPYYYPYPVLKTVKPGYTQYGIASWYGPDFHGKRTADGEIYNMYAHTAASRTLPFNTLVKVINLDNGRSTVVRINDRGPFVKGRIIDLSYAAAKDLGMIATGTARVKLIVLGNNSYANSKITYSKPEQPSLNQLEKITIDTHLNENLNGFDNFAIQLGAFRSLYNAIKFKDRLMRYIKGIRIVKAVVRGVELYRVVVGSFDSKEAARSFGYKYILPYVGKFYIISQ